MENLNGRRLVEAGDLCERRNGKAIDFLGSKIYMHTRARAHRDTQTPL